MLRRMAVVFQDLCYRKFAYTKWVDAETSSAWPKK